jgi:hypothetical protein
MRKIVIQQNVYICTEAEFQLLRKLHRESKNPLSKFSKSRKDKKFFLEKLVPFLEKVDEVDLVIDNND